MEPSLSTSLALELDTRSLNGPARAACKPTRATKSEAVGGARRAAEARARGGRRSGRARAARVTCDHACEICDRSRLFGSRDSTSVTRRKTNQEKAQNDPYFRAQIRVEGRSGNSRGSAGRRTNDHHKRRGLDVACVWLPLPPALRHASSLPPSLAWMNLSVRRDRCTRRRRVADSTVALDDVGHSIGH